MLNNLALVKTEDVYELPLNRSARRLDSVQQRNSGSSMSSSQGHSNNNLVVLGNDVIDRRRTIGDRSVDRLQNPLIDAKAYLDAPECVVCDIRRHHFIERIQVSALDQVELTPDNGLVLSKWHNSNRSEL